MHRQLKPCITLLLALVLGVGCSNKRPRNPDTPAARQAKMQEVLKNPEVKQAEAKLVRAFSAICQSVAESQRKAGQPAPSRDEIDKGVQDMMAQVCKVLGMLSTELTTEPTTNLSETDKKNAIDNAFLPLKGMFGGLRAQGATESQIDAAADALRTWIELISKKYTS